MLIRLLLVAGALLGAFYAGQSLAGGGRVWFAVAALPFLLFFMARPAIGIIAFLLFYPFLPFSEGISLVEILSAAFVGLLAFAWFFSSQLRGRKVYSPHGVDTFLLAWFGWLLLSLLVSKSYGGDGLAWARDIVPFANLLLLLPIKDYFTTARQVDGLFRVMVAVLSVGTLISTLPYVGLRIPFISPPATSYHPIVLLLLGLGLLTASRRFLDPLGMSAVLVGSALILLTSNRTVLFSAIIAGLLFVLVTRASGGVAIAGFFLLFAGYILYLGIADFRPERLEEKRARLESLVATEQDMSLKNRKDEATEAWNLFLDRPFFGVGMGYEYRFWRNYIMGIGPGYLKTNFTHSDFMNLLAKTGIIGVILYLGFLITMLRIGWNVISRSRDRRRRALAAALTVAVAMSQVLGQSTPVLQTREASYVLVFVIGLLLCVHRQEMEGQVAEAEEEAQEG